MVAFIFMNSLFLMIKGVRGESAGTKEIRAYTNADWKILINSCTVWEERNIRFQTLGREKYSFSEFCSSPFYLCMYHSVF